MCFDLYIVSMILRWHAHRSSIDTTIRTLVEFTGDLYVGWYRYVDRLILGMLLYLCLLANQHIGSDCYKADYTYRYSQGTNASAYPIPIKVCRPDNEEIDITFKEKLQALHTGYPLSSYKLVGSIMRTLQRRFVHYYYYVTLRSSYPKIRTCSFTLRTGVSLMTSLYWWRSCLQKKRTM